MENLCRIIILLFTGTSILAIPEDPCPLQCFCDLSANTDGYKVHCIAAKFSELPKFPKSTTNIEFSGKSEIKRIQTGAFAGLTKLDSLTITNTIPWDIQISSISMLKNLQHLRIVSSKDSQLPTDILGRMQLVSLGLNMRYSEIPYKIICTQSHRLEVLNLASNQIQSANIDKCFGNIRSLHTLYLSENLITHILKDDFIAFKGTNLSSLTLSSCKIATIDQDAFRSLSSLTELFLDGNGLKNVNKTLFQNMNNLKKLVLSKNQFTKMPCESIGKLHNLEHLYFSDNTHCNVTVLCPEFEKLTKLDDLQLLNVNIPKAGDAFFTSVKHVETLYISPQNFSKKAFSGLKMLNYVDIRGKITDVANLANALTGMANTPLHTLYITDIPTIHTIPANILQPLKNSNLTKLKLVHFGIKSLALGVFTSISRVTHLDLSNNIIPGFEPYLFNPLGRLEELVLDNNHLSDFVIGPSTGFWSLQPSLQRIYLKKNSIQVLRAGCFKGLTNLKVLDLYKNQISSITSNILNSESLKSLNLRHNQIGHLTENTFAQAHSITGLNLQGNEIVLVTPGSKQVFKALKNLTYLNLHGIILSQEYKDQYYPFMFQDCTLLQELKLGSARIQTLPESVFAYNMQLILLDLNNNLISTWNPKVFKNLMRLNSLFLSDNKIMTVTKESFQYLVSLKELVLTKNPLLCNCDLIWFRKWITTVNINIPMIQNQHNYHCVAPEKYRGVALINFHMADSECRSYTFLKLSVTFAAAVLLVLIVAAVVYR